MCIYTMYIMYICIRCIYRLININIARSRCTKEPMEVQVAAKPTREWKAATWYSGCVVTTLAAPSKLLERPKAQISELVTLLDLHSATCFLPAARLEQLRALKVATGCHSYLWHRENASRKSQLS